MRKPARWRVTVPERAVPSSPESTPGIALKALQQQFVREVLYRDGKELRSSILDRSPGAERRIGIYRTNARENFALALEAAFPLLLRCVGPEEFRRLAWSYQRACPSPAGNLFHVGRRLPAFLADHLPGTGDEYQIDVARLEWQIQESLVAGDDDAVLDLAALAAVPAARQAEIRFRLHPSARLLRTEYGVFALWEALQAGHPVPAARREPESLLVLRRATGVELQRLPGTDLAWLEALRAGATFGEAAEVLPATAQVALGELLVRWVASGVVTAFD